MPFSLSKFFPGFFWLMAAGALLFFAPEISVAAPALDYSYTPSYTKMTAMLDWEEKIATFSAKPADLDTVFARAAQTYGVDKNILTKIAKCESNFHAGSVNPGGPYLGMFQYLESTWVATRKAMGADPDPKLVFNAEEAIKTSAWKIAHGGIDAWPVCGK